MQHQHARRIIFIIANTPTDKIFLVCVKQIISVTAFFNVLAVATKASSVARSLK